MNTAITSNPLDLENLQQSLVKATTLTVVTIDTHTAGEPTRIAVSGIPKLPAGSVMERKEYLRQHGDWFRRLLMLEPRGHGDMFGAILVPPQHPEAEHGIIFMDTGGYLNMCCHGSIGVATALVKYGLVNRQEPHTDITLETPSGLVQARVDLKKGKVGSVTITNVPSFLFQRDAAVTLPGVGLVRFDIAFGGSFFAIVQAAELKIKLHPQEISKIIPLGIRLREAINRDYQVSHPTLPIQGVDLVEIHDYPNSPDANARNLVVFAASSFDRSPCGTGTSARLAQLFARGEIAIDQPYVNENLLGLSFTGKVLSTTRVGDFPAIIPQITGSAFITGVHTFGVDAADPLGEGFLLGH
ncbi:MAG: proline racemase family protein [Planctomycetota bacterium]|jgi:proline racemase|nr:proline racemase family protein [Planctomycetota bacterium]